jgi:hypothetical protein
MTPEDRRWRKDRLEIQKGRGEGRKGPGRNFEKARRSERISRRRDLKERSRLRAKFEYPSRLYGHHEAEYLCSLPSWLQQSYPVTTTSKWYIFAYMIISLKSQREPPSLRVWSRSVN